MKELVVLFLGATGALLAIFLKEAVQHALQRRVIAWQLGGYLMAYKANIVREAQLVGLYNTVDQRLKMLDVSYAKGIAAFEAQHLAQVKVRDDIRKTLQQGIEKADAVAAVEIDEYLKKSLDLAGTVLAERRQLLIDSKSFLSDKDAAMLGRAVAMNVIQFRTAMVDTLSAFEQFIAVGRLEGEKKPEAIAKLADQIFVQGEQALIAFIRLERHAERISLRSIPQLVYDVLRGR